MTGWTAKIYGRLSHHFIFYLKKEKSKFQKHKQTHDVTAAILQYKTMNMLAKQQTKKSCGDWTRFQRKTFFCSKKLVTDARFDVNMPTGGQGGMGARE